MILGLYAYEVLQNIPKIDLGWKYIVIPAFFFKKKGYINFVSKSVRRPSFRPSVRPCVRPSVTFLVNVSPPKPLEIATSNFVGE